MSVKTNKSFQNFAGGYLLARSITASAAPLLSKSRKFGARKYWAVKYLAPIGLGALIGLAFFGHGYW